MINHFIGIFIIFGSGLALLMSISQLLGTERRIGNKILATLYIIISLLILEHYLSVRLHVCNEFNDCPFQASIFVVLCNLKYLVGPLFFFYIQSLILKDFAINVKRFFHFIPFVVIIILSFFLIYYRNLQIFYYDNILGILHRIGFLHMLLYVFLTLKNINVMRLGSDNMDVTLKIAVFVLCFILLLIVPFIIATFLRFEFFETFGISLTSLLIIFLFLSGQLYPEFMQWISKEIKRNRYERSLIKGLNTDDIKRRIEDLMEDEKLFCDEDLTLNKLAEHLSISSHQLSEFLNNILNTNFKSYINKYRINEAKQLLINDTTRSILSIAFAVGFNSKSVFYSAFTKFTDKSPVQYRKEES